MEHCLLHLPSINRTISLSTRAALQFLTAFHLPLLLASLPCLIPAFILCLCPCIPISCTLFITPPTPYTTLSHLRDSIRVKIKSNIPFQQFYSTSILSSCLSQYVLIGRFYDTQRTQRDPKLQRNIH